MANGEPEKPMENLLYFERELENGNIVAKEIGDGKLDYSSLAKSEHYHQHQIRRTFQDRKED